MPRVTLTQEQREAAALERMRETLADGILIRKARNRLTNEQIGHGLEIGENPISRIINGYDVKLNLSQILRLMRFAGIKLVRSDPYETPGNKTEA